MFFSGINFAPMAQRAYLATDFSEYALSSALTSGDWTSKSVSGNLTTLVGASTTAISDRRVAMSQGSIDVRGVAWNRIPSSTTDIEILAVIQWGSAGSNGGSGLLARSSSDTYASYNCVQHGTASIVHGVFEAAEIVAGNYTKHTQGSTVPVAGTRYFVRFQCSGTTIRGKVWAVGSSEPSSWESSWTNSNRSSGFAGLVMVDTTPTWYCEFFSAGLGGATAPFPNG